VLLWFNGSSDNTELSRGHIYSLLCINVTTTFTVYSETQTTFKGSDCLCLDLVEVTGDFHNDTHSISEY